MRPPPPLHVRPHNRNDLDAGFTDCNARRGAWPGECKNDMWQISLKSNQSFFFIVLRMTGRSTDVRILTSARRLTFFYLIMKRPSTDFPPVSNGKFFFWRKRPSETPGAAVGNHFVRFLKCSTPTGCFFSPPKT